MEDLMKNIALGAGSVIPPGIVHLDCPGTQKPGIAMPGNQVSGWGLSGLAEVIGMHNLSSGQKKILRGMVPVQIRRPSVPEASKSRTARAGNGIWVFMAITLVATVLCSAMGCTQNIPAGQGKVELSFPVDVALFGRPPASSGGARGTKTLSPADSWTVTSYTITGSGPEGATFTRDSTRTSFSMSLAPGAWTITVQGLNAAKKPVAGSTATVALEAGRTSRADLRMLPLPGNGSLAITITKPSTSPSSMRISGTLFPIDGPAQAYGVARPTSSFPVDLEANAGSFELNDVPAGYYNLSLILGDASGSIAGSSETVAILAGFETKGTIYLKAGDPGFGLTITLPDCTPLEGLAFPARHKASGNLPYRAEVAGAPGQSTVQWSANGAELGSTVAPVELDSGSGIRLASGSLCDPENLASTVTFNAAVREALTGKVGSAGEITEFVNGPRNSTLAWKSVYGASAALAPSVAPGTPGSGVGKDIPTPVKAVASSGDKALVLVAGLDASNAVHAFSLSPEGALFRIWRDEVKVNSSSKTPDRLAVAGTGRHAAAAGSSSSWLRIYSLGNAGEMTGSIDFTSSLPGLGSLSYVKSLAFSKDGTRLYALTNSPESILVFSTPSGGTPGFESRFDIDALFPGQSLSMSGLAVGEEGILAASASGVNRLIILKQTGMVLELVQNIDKTFAGADMTKPEALTFSADGKDLYVLCDRESIKQFRSASTSENYAPVNTVALGAAMTEATSIAFLPPTLATGPGGRIVVSGGEGPASFTRNSGNGILQSGSMLDPEGDASLGLSGVAGITVARNRLVLGGNGSTVCILEIPAP